LSYTRAPGMTYHAIVAASTARADLITQKPLVPAPVAPLFRP